jgi:Uncharacterized protein conserved in bacteria (DUF2272)
MVKARPFVAGLTLLLAACVTKPVIETITGKPIPESEVKSTILALTRGEWEAFGKQRVYWEDGVQVIKPVGLWEDDRLGSERVAEYWRVLDPESELSGKDCADPWSAAFISWVMIRSGVDPRQFTRSAAHRDYVRTIVAHADDPAFKFTPRAPADYAPRPGDIICRGRGSTREITDFHALPAGAELHCDIVVANANGKLESIGGNVRQSVSLSEREVDAAGKLGTPWFVVIENRYSDPLTPVAFR